MSPNGVKHVRAAPRHPRHRRTASPLLYLAAVLRAHPGLTAIVAWLTFGGSVIEGGSLPPLWLTPATSKGWRWGLSRPGSLVLHAVSLVVELAKYLLQKVFQGCEADDGVPGAGDSRDLCAFRRMIPSS